MVTGNRQALGWMLGVQETEVSGSLNSAIHALTFMRTGDVDRAISVYETRVHAAVVSLPQSRDWEQLPASTRRALVLAKHYLAVFPVHTESEEVPEDLREVLRWIPDEPLDPESSSPAVRFLLEREQETKEKQIAHGSMHKSSSLFRGRALDSFSVDISEDCDRVKESS